MIAIAQRIPEKVFIVKTSDDRGRIVDAVSGNVSPEQLIDSFLKWGDWMNVADQDDASKAVAIAEKAE